MEISAAVSHSLCILGLCTESVLSLYRAMQELVVHFQPEPSVPPPTPSTLSSLATMGGQSGESPVCHKNTLRVKTWF